MSFIENHFSELSGTVTVTPARPRRREANVQQRVAVIEALGRSVGPERAERIERAVASSGGRGLSPTDRAAYIKAENAVEGEDETVSRVDDSGSELFATPNDPRRLMATDRRGNVTLQAPRGLSGLLGSAASLILGTSNTASAERVARLSYGPGGPPVRPTPESDSVGTVGTSDSGTPDSSTSDSTATQLLFTTPGPGRAAGAATPGASASTILPSFGDVSSVDGPGPSAGSPTLDGSSANATELERMRGSIERLTTQVNSGRGVLATASRGLKGASPDERVQLLGTLQDDPELQKLVRAGLMDWDDIMRPNPAKGSEGHVAGVDADTPVIDDKKLAALQSRLGTAAQKQANDLTRVQQVVERRRTTAGAVPAAAGAFYPGLKVWTPAAFAPPIPPGRR